MIYKTHTYLNKNLKKLIYHKGGVDVGRDLPDLYKENNLMIQPIWILEWHPRIIWEIALYSFIGIFIAEFNGCPFSISHHLSYAEVSLYGIPPFFRQLFKKGGDAIDLLLS
ncbi:MAG: hypothetical protein V3U71_01025 [Cocleimonas sp.]